MKATNCNSLNEAVTSYQEEVARRLKIAALCERDSGFRALEYEMCRRSPEHFINNWCDTFDPRREPYHLPFKLWSFQENYIQWLSERFKNRENGLVEKSRDMGISWLSSAWATWHFLFHKGFVCRFGSRKEDLVDDGTADSIFGKIRYLMQRLPKFLRPFKMQKDNDRYLYIKNPANGNLFIGESTNTSFGRGGRSSVVFLDEFAHVPHSEAVWASIKGNADCIIAMSSPNGMGNQFAWLRHETKIPVATYHWTVHPLKDRAWYEKESAEMKPWQIAQELDISYERSKHGKIYQRFDRAWHIAKESIPCKPEFEQWVTWDFGRAGAMAMIWLQVSPDGVTEAWNCFEFSGQDIDFFTPIAFGQRPVFYDILDAKDKKLVDQAVGKIPREYFDALIRHCGDHAGTAKTANSNRSCKDAIKRAGKKYLHTEDFEFRSSGKQGYDWRFTCLDHLLRLEPRHREHTTSFHSKFVVSPDCKRLIDCLNNATWDSENLHSDKINPKLDEFFHMVSALEFFAINRFPISKTPAPKAVQWR